MPKRLDLVGQQFGRLLVTAYADNTKWGEAQWFCKCDCGTEIIVRGHHLKNGHTKNCGCYMREKSSETHRLNLVGQEFGRWVIISDAGNDKQGGSQWPLIEEEEIKYKGITLKDLEQGALNG